MIATPRTDAVTLKRQMVEGKDCDCPQCELIRHAKALERDLAVARAVAEGFEDMAHRLDASVTYAVTSRSALERARWTINNLVGGHSIRDCDEVLAEIDSAIAALSSNSSEPTFREKAAASICQTIVNHLAAKRDEEGNARRTDEGPSFTRTLDQLIAWLDKKFGRHGEWCDKLAAEALRAFRGTAGNLSFDGGGRVKVHDLDALVKSPRVQEQVQAVREMASEQSGVGVQQPRCGSCGFVRGVHELMEGHFLCPSDFDANGKAHIWGPEEWRGRATPSQGSVGTANAQEG